MTTKLTRDERAIIAAHEAGMHDRKPQPATCKSCKVDAIAAEMREESRINDTANKLADRARSRQPRQHGRPTKVSIERARVEYERVARKPKPVTKPAIEDADLPTWDNPAVPVDPKPATPLPEPPKRKAEKFLAAIDKGDGDDKTVRVTIEETPDGPKVVDVQPVYTSREAWLMAGVEVLRPMFDEAGMPLVPVRVSVGWPAGRSAKANTIGQCFQGVLVADSVPAIFISPVLTDPVEVLSTLVHELVHSVVPVSSKPHVGAFVKLAKAVGLTGKWTSTVAGPELKERLTGIAEKLGPFTHSKVSKGSIGRKVQTTRMLKVTCQDCGCVIRMTKKWLDEVGAPTCACDGEMREAE